MKEFDFEAANKLDWSNEYLDFVIALKLLTLVYETRPQSKDFRKARAKLQNQCLKDIGDVTQLAELFREAFPLGPIGASRSQTNTTMANFLGELVQGAFQGALIQNSEWSRNFCADPVVNRMWASFNQFSVRYKDYLAQGLGGIWKPPISSHKYHNPKKINLIFLESHSSPKQNKIFLDSRIGSCFEYLRGLMNLYYESGLNCWWGPILRFKTDMAAWIGGIKPKSQPSPTLDGMLGPIFWRLYKNTGDSIDNLDEKTISVNNYPEYLLLAMTRKDMRRKIGQDNEPAIHKQMEDWGYVHGNKWERVDFDMLFDRLYNNLSIENIAEDYRLSDSTIKRHTDNLALILGIPFPKAFHSRREGL